MPNTVRLHRVLATKPDKVYRAFVEADAMAKWLPPLVPGERLRYTDKLDDPNLPGAIRVTVALNPTVLRH